jgi:hypothetical protein
MRFLPTFCCVPTVVELTAFHRPFRPSRIQNVQLSHINVTLTNRGIVPLLQYIQKLRHIQLDDKWGQACR